jgi:hypothetical protein
MALGSTPRRTKVKKPSAERVVDNEREDLESDC